jgi:hypothetical protein
LLTSFERSAPCGRKGWRTCAENGLSPICCGLCELPSVEQVGQLLCHLLQPIDVRRSSLRDGYRLAVQLQLSQHPARQLHPLSARLHSRVYQETEDCVSDMGLRARGHRTLTDMQDIVSVIQTRRPSTQQQRDPCVPRCQSQSRMCSTGSFGDVAGFFAVTPAGASTHQSETVGAADRISSAEAMVEQSRNLIY